MAVATYFIYSDELAVLLLIAWRDGDPAPWLWIAIATAPAGVVTGAIAWISAPHEQRRLAAGATVVSAALTALWILGAVLLLQGLE